MHCRRKEDSKPSARPRRSPSQPSDSDTRRSILEAVAKQTGAKLVEQAPPTETGVSDTLSDEEVERKSKTIMVELASNGDYKVCGILISSGVGGRDMLFGMCSRWGLYVCVPVSRGSCDVLQ